MHFLTAFDSTLQGLNIKVLSKQSRTKIPQKLKIPQESTTLENEVCTLKRPISKGYLTFVGELLHPQLNEIKKQIFIWLFDHSVTSKNYFIIAPLTIFLNLPAYSKLFGINCV